MTRRKKFISSKEKKKREIEDIVYYLCGRISKDKLLLMHQKWIDKKPNLMEVKNNLTNLMEDMNQYASHGFLKAMLEVLEKIDNILSQVNLFFPEDLEDFYIKTGLLNGIPREYKFLREAMRNQHSVGIQKRWKLFSNYIIMLKSQFEDEQLTEGEKAVLDKWVAEYNNLIDRYPNLFS
ncbi:MAG: hypothetical protein EU549_03085 [Promethearchaeota archaeon]|nr:MAG: hypothetical protein EU549_03085 [Candidatus Lokiarchaeota archaeon]